MSRLAQLQKLAQMAPHDPLTHYGVGLECMNLQDWPAAIAAFAATIKADGAYSAAYYHKARAEIAAGRAADARATLDSGLAVAKANGDWKTQNEMRELLESIP